MTELKQVPLWQVRKRNNYRQSYDANFVAQMACAMSTTGYRMKDPMQVYVDGEMYIVIDGNTRHEAALLGSTYDLTTHQPTMLVWVAVEDRPSDAAFKLMQLAANEQRRDPDDISKAIGYQQALDAGATLDDVMQSVGHTREYVENRLNLLNLVPDAQELVAKKQLGMKFANELIRLDPNFQRVALVKYRDMKAPTLDEFRDVVNQLYAKQSQCSLFDLALFNGKPVEAILADLKIARKKSVKELEAELAEERRKAEQLKARANETIQRINTELAKERQQKERVARAADKEIKRLRALLAEQGKIAQPGLFEGVR